MICRGRSSARYELALEFRSMGKASQGKRGPVSSLQVESLRLAAELVCVPAVQGEFLSERLRHGPSLAERVRGVAGGFQHAAANDPRTIGTNAEFGPGPASSADWAAGMVAAFHNREFGKILETAIAIAHRDFWGKDPVGALVFGLNARPPNTDSIAIAIAQAYRRLVGNAQDPGWTALALFTIARMIAVNGRRQFDSNEWTDASLAMFDLERFFLAGDGKNMAQALVVVNRRYFRGQLAQILGGRLLHGLAEAAINATGATIFRAPL